MKTTETGLIAVSQMNGFLLLYTALRNSIDDNPTLRCIYKIHLLNQDINNNIMNYETVLM